MRTDALVPAWHLPDLTEPEIADRLNVSSRLTDKRTEIENLARLVFGNGQVASTAAQGISDARPGYAAADNVREGKLADIAGHGGTSLCRPGPERQTAEANVPKLAAALAVYGVAVDFERHQIVSDHREEQARLRLEIPRPSYALANVLGAERQEQVRRLNAEPALKREVQAISSAIDRRFSHAEKTDLRGGNIVRRGQSLE